MNEQAKISIIVPVYNREKWLEETILSVMAQTYSNWELLLIDDGSSDRSIELAKAYALEDTRIKSIIRNSLKKGASVCRNIGIKNSSGEFILFLDSDDLLAPFALEQRYALISSAKVDFVVFPMLLFQEKPFDMMLLQNTETGEDYIDRFLNRDLPWVISGPLWSKSALEKIGGLNEDLPGFQDMELNIKALISGASHRVKLDAVPDNYYRQHKTDTIGASRDQPHHYRAQLLLIKQLNDLLIQNNQLNAKRKLLLAQYGLHLSVCWRFHLANSECNAREEANECWKFILDAGLISSAQFESGNRYITFKFNMRYNRFKWLQRRKENKFVQSELPELIWKRGSTQAKIRYSGPIQPMVNQQK